MINAQKYWNERMQIYGHTGDVNAIIYRYDQALRLRTLKRLLEEKKLWNDKQDKVLDIGCGTGDFIQLLLDVGAPRVTGIDISDKVISFAKMRFESLKNVELINEKIEEFKCPTRLYSTTFAVNVLQHIYEYDLLDKAIKNICRSTKGNGFIIAMDFWGNEDKTLSEDNYVMHRKKTSYIDIFEKNGATFVEELGLPRIAVKASRKLASWAKKMKKTSGGIAVTSKSDVGGNLSGNQAKKKWNKKILTEMFFTTSIQLFKPIDYFLPKLAARHTDMGFLVFKAPQ